MARIDGDNELNILFGTNEADQIFAADGDDTLIGNNGGDELFGQAGSDFLSGGAGSDRLEGTDADGTAGKGEKDRLNGGPDRDLFVLGRRDGNQGLVYYNDGDNTSNGTDDLAFIRDFNKAEGDQIQFAGEEKDYVFNRAVVNRTAGTGIFLDTNRNGSFDETDELIAIIEDPFELEGNEVERQHFLFLGGVVEVPTDADDVIFGTADQDVINSLKGDDQSRGFDGNDFLGGGEGSDTLFGGRGNDNLLGVSLAVPESTQGKGEVDILVGGPGSDRFQLGQVSNGIIASVFYDDGDDSSLGNLDFAIISDFEEGVDSLLMVGKRQDYFVGASPVANLTGDSLFLDTNQNGRHDSTDELIAVFTGFSRLSDTLDNTGFAEGDLINHAPAPDVPDNSPSPAPPPETVPIPSDGDRDLILGTNQDDTLDGNDQANRMFGLQGNDTLNGNGGNDTLQGAGNPDIATSIGEGEIDRLNGGAGQDTFVLHTNRGMTVLYDEGNRRNPGKQDFAIIEDFNKGQDSIEVAGSPDDYLIGRSNVRNIADGRAIYLDTNNNGRLNRRRDELIAVVEGVRNLSLDDIEVVDIPVIIGTNQSERLQGSGQDGILDGRNGRDRINAKGGDDIILGGKGNDLLNGGGGDDILDGGLGKDKYRGKGGSDVFVIREGPGGDGILDFKDSKDVIGLTKGLTVEDLDIAQRRNKAILKLDGEKLAVVKGAREGQFGAEDFVSIDYTRFEGMKVPIVASGFEQAVV